MSERAEMECKRCGDNEDRIDGFCSNECKDKYSLEAALSKMSIRISELEAELDVEKRLSNQLYLLLVDNPKEKKLADLLTEAIRGTDAPIFTEDKK